MVTTWNGMSAAWARHAMCESAFKGHVFVDFTPQHLDVIWVQFYLIRT